MISEVLAKCVNENNRNPTLEELIPAFSEAVDQGWFSVTSHWSWGVEATVKLPEGGIVSTVYSTDDDTGLGLPREEWAHLINSTWGDFTFIGPIPAIDHFIDANQGNLGQRI